MKQSKKFSIDFSLHTFSERSAKGEVVVGSVNKEEYKLDLRDRSRNTKLNHF